jgi:hypothetical protein
MTEYIHVYYTLDSSVGYRQLCIRSCPTAFTTDSSTIQNLGLCLGVGTTPYNAPGPNATAEAAVQCPSYAYGAFQTGVIDQCFPFSNNTLTKEATKQFNAGASEVSCCEIVVMVERVVGDGGW